MSGSESLAQRIKAEFDAQSQRVSAQEQEQSKNQQDREARLTKFNALCEELKAIWRPRLEEFAKQFGDKVKVTPNISPSLREAKVIFMTDMANVTLTFTAAPNTDVTKIVLDYDLQILPIFFEYERHSRLELPIEGADKAALGKWMDDRLVACVKTYLSLKDNEFYVRRALVSDPISGKQFLKDEARATLDHGGRTQYFHSEDSLKTFKERHNL